MENSGENSKANFMQHFNIKERSVNFTKNEVAKLQVLVDKYKHILMCKKTDGTSIKQKDHVWNAIHGEFNATGQMPRTVKQLKYKFENMKRSAKKEATKERQEMIRTGGGKLPSLSPGSEDAADWLRSVMSVSIDGNEAVYDDDVITPNRVSIHDTTNILSMNTENEENNSIQKEPNLERNITEESPVVTDAVVVDLPQSIDVFDSSTPHSSLKKPLSAPLKKQLYKRNASDNIIKRTLRERKITILNNINDLEIEKIKLSIQHQRELHEQTLRHNEEIHKLEIMKLQLEVDLLREKNVKTSNV